VFRQQVEDVDSGLCGVWLPTFQRNVSPESSRGCALTNIVTLVTV
jgi:hypothetical protein